MYVFIQTWFRVGFSQWVFLFCLFFVLFGGKESRIWHFLSGDDAGRKDQPCTTSLSNVMV